MSVMSPLISLSLQPDDEDQLRTLAIEDMDLPVADARPKRQRSQTHQQVEIATAMLNSIPAFDDPNVSRIIDIDEEPHRTSPQPMQEGYEETEEAEEEIHEVAVVWRLTNPLTWPAMLKSQFTRRFGRLAGGPIPLSLQMFQETCAFSQQDRSLEQLPTNEFSSLRWTEESLHPVVAPNHYREFINEPHVYYLSSRDAPQFGIAFTPKEFATVEPILENKVGVLSYTKVKAFACSLHIPINLFAQITRTMLAQSQATAIESMIQVQPHEKLIYVHHPILYGVGFLVTFKNFEYWFSMYNPKPTMYSKSIMMCLM